MTLFSLNSGVLKGSTCEERGGVSVTSSTCSLTRACCWRCRSKPRSGSVWVPARASEPNKSSQSTSCLISIIMKWTQAPGQVKTSSLIRWWRNRNIFSDHSPPQSGPFHKDREQTTKREKEKKKKLRGIWEAWHSAPLVNNSTSKLAYP